MTKRRDNMLEAFRESSRIEKEPSPPQPRAGQSLPFPDGGKDGPGPAAARQDAAEAAEATAGESSASAGPAPERKLGRGTPPDLVGVAGLPGRGAAPPPAATPPSRSSRTQITLPIGREWLFGLLTIALTGAFLFGRWSAGTIEAAGKTDPAPATESAQVPVAAPGALRPPADDPRRGAAARPAASQLTPADQAFLDPANAFTVVAITYDDTENGRQRAIDTYRHLQEAGFEVVYPRRKSGRLLLFVGASPGYRDLESVEGKLRRTPGPNGQLAFTGAYRVNIADYR